MIEPQGVTILFFGKAQDELCAHAAHFLTQHTGRTEVHLGRRGDPFPEVKFERPFDYIISYLSPWVVPPQVLQCAERAAINFHPGPPEYPGIGCTNFALYDGVKTYGVTCHTMDPKVDSGAIIQVDRFPVYPKDTVLSLTNRCYAHIAVMFYELADLLLRRVPLSHAGEQWTRRPFLRRELDELCSLQPGMSEAEVSRRVRATTFPGYPGAGNP